jgi:Ca2+-binding EF-hand superfamily protein
VLSTGIASRATLPTSNYGGTGSRYLESEDGLLKILTEHVALERGLERAKQTLINHQDFNMFDAFRIFDVDGKGSISAKEFFYGLSDIGVNSQMEDVELFFARYNKKRNGRLDFGEFADALDSSDDYLKVALARRSSSHRHLNIYRKDDLFYPETANSFKELLMTHLRVEASAESMRQHLAKNPYFDLNTAYDLADYARRGAVTKDELRMILERRGCFISDQEARSVARKFDFNNDGIITFSEFVDEVRPKSPVRRI